MAIMVLQFDISFKELFGLKRSYRQNSPRCRDRIWRQGFVEAYFDCFDQPLWLKRYRCPDGQGVPRLRPRGYFKRSRTAIFTIHAVYVANITKEDFSDHEAG
jgi:hypothetical protein